MKLNFDGSAKSNLGAAGVGVVIHNREGFILLSYSVSAGFCSINKAELMALKSGLLEAKNLNVSHLSIEWLFLCDTMGCREIKRPMVLGRLFFFGRNTC